MSPIASQRVQQLPPYLFQALDQAADEALAKGVDLVDLHVGDPDLEPPLSVIAAMKQALDCRDNHYYPSYVGKRRFRAAAAAWIKRNYGADFDPDGEVLTLIGSKEGMAHLPLAFVNPGDHVLVPDPYFPMYVTTARFAGGVVSHYPLTMDRGFQPDFEAIDPDLARRTALMILNYPHNPTGAVADRETFAKAVDFARQYDILLVQDNAYSDVFTGSQRPLSIFSVPGAREVAVELYSLSKTYNAPGWRMGFAVGAKELITPLAKVKNQIDSGVFGAVQDGGVAALEMPDIDLEPMRAHYRQRRNLVRQTLEPAGYRVFDGGASLFMWVGIPTGEDSAAFCNRALKEQAVLLAPGRAFGEQGEGFFRLALCQPEERIALAMQRLARMG